MVDLLIKNGHVVFPGKGVIKCNIAVNNEEIEGIYDLDKNIEAKHVIDVEGLHVFPGVIDAHEHLGIYNSIEEDFSDTKQHAVGGITTIVNYDRQPMSYLEWFPEIRKKAEQNSYIDFAYSLGILTEQHIDELGETVNQLGVTSYKFFRNYERQLNDKFQIENGIDLSSFDLMRLLQKFNSISPKLLLAIHCENMDINRKLISKFNSLKENEGLKTWSKTSPGYGEAESMISTLYLNKVSNGNVFIVHLSAGASVDALEKMPWLIERGVKVETCPHYLCLNEHSSVGLKAKVGPPIHTQEDSNRLWDAIEKGLINAIGTDHVPNSLSVKHGNGEGTFETLYGFPSAGALLPIMITEGHLKRNIPLERIADITSQQVANSFNLPQKGRIEIGADADFAIVNLNEVKTVTSELIYSKSDYGIFDGRELKGWPVYTISRGELIVENGVPVKENGRGKYIKRTI